MAATVYTPDRATQGTQQDTAALERRIRDLETRLSEVELYAPSAIVVFRPNGTASPTLLYGPKVESMTTKSTSAQLIVTFKPGAFPGYRELAGNPFPCGLGAMLTISDPSYWTGAYIRANITSEAPNRKLQVAILAVNEAGTPFDFQTATTNTCTLLIFGGIR